MKTSILFPNLRSDHAWHHHILYLCGENRVRQVLIADLHGCCALFGVRPCVRDHCADNLTDARHLGAQIGRDFFLQILNKMVAAACFELSRDSFNTIEANLDTHTCAINLFLSEELLIISKHRKDFRPRNIFGRDDIDNAGNPQGLARVQPPVGQEAKTRRGDLHRQWLRDCWLGKNRSLHPPTLT